MIWSNWTDFWAMGGYGLYVWGSFGVTAGLMALEIFWLKRARQLALTQVSSALAVAETQEKDWRA